MRVKKREVVIPFEGEEMFIVPKRGGFGQPDMEGYVMAVGGNVTTQDNPNDPANTGTSGTTNTNTNTTTTPPINDEPTPPTPPPATAEQMCASSGGTYVNGVCQPRVVSEEPSPAETTCIANGGLYQNGVCITSNSPKPPVVTDLPNFPVWSTLDCTTLKDKIAEYNAILSTSTLSQQIAGAYSTEIAKAQGIYNGKCNITPPAPSTPPELLTILPVGGGIGGGGGGGFGKPPINEVAPKPVEKKKTNMGLFLIIGGIGLLYLLTRKKKP